MPAVVLVGQVLRRKPAVILAWVDPAVGKRSEVTGPVGRPIF